MESRDKINKDIADKNKKTHVRLDLFDPDKCVTREEYYQQLRSKQRLVGQDDNLKKDQEEQVDNRNPQQEHRPLTRDEQNQEIARFAADNANAWPRPNM